MKKYSILFYNFLFCFFGYAQDPNIIFIIADDLGWDALNGGDVLSVKPNTPHLDSLRNSGVTFSQAWSYPVCTPTRASMMSGKYGVKTGVTTAPGNLEFTHISIFNALKDANPSYETAAIGKWHISQPAQEEHPITHGAGHYTGILGATWTAYDDWDKTEDGVTTASTEYATTYFTDDAINWVDDQEGPFFLWLAHIAPHSPFHVPPAHMHTQTNTSGQLRKYLAMVESLDYEVGRLIDSLDPEVRENTVFIFIGDNGTPNNMLQVYPDDRGKQTLYQGGVHVPMFVTGPGVTRIGETEGALVNVLDIYATVLELAGEDLPGGIYNSLSFKGFLTDTDQIGRTYNYTELSSNGKDITVDGFTIRSSKYKLIEYLGNIQELYDLENDPYELNNLLLGTLTAEQENVKIDLEEEANQIRMAWSCNDHIQNGEETGIDCGGSLCSTCPITAIDDEEINDGVDFFPNPSDHSISFDTKIDEIKTIQIFNNLGRMILEEKEINSSKALIDVQSLEPGQYIAKLIFNDFNQTIDFVKQ